MINNGTDNHRTYQYSAVLVSSTGSGTGLLGLLGTSSNEDIVQLSLFAN